MTDCLLCQHYRRTQRGPHAWNCDCALSQAAFPHAMDCAFYQPPPLPETGAERGLGYVWDGEFDGPA